MQVALGRLDSPDDYAMLQGEEAVLKFLLRVDGRQPPAPLAGECVFQNTALFPWHIQFLLSFEQLAYLDTSSYLELVLRRSSRVWLGGRVFATAPTRRRAACRHRPCGWMASGFRRMWPS